VIASRVTPSGRTSPDLRAQPRPPVHGPRSTRATVSSSASGRRPATNARRSAVEWDRDRRLSLRGRLILRKDVYSSLAQPPRRSTTSACRARVSRGGRVPGRGRAGARRLVRAGRTPVGPTESSLTPAIPVDAAFLDAAGRSCASSPTTPSVSTTSTRRDTRTRDRRLEHAGRPHQCDGRACGRAHARAPAPDRRGRSLTPAPRPLGSGGRTSWSGEGSRASRRSRRRPGRIGPRVGELAEAHGRNERLAGRGDDLSAPRSRLRRRDLHCPLTPETRHLIDARRACAMKPTAVLVNTARGRSSTRRARRCAAALGARGRLSTSSSTSRPCARSSCDGERRPHAPHRERNARDTHAMGMLVVSALRAVLLEDRIPDNAV
jgi:hypothetical protein